MEIIFHDIAWEDYLYWQNQDKKTLKKINSLIKSIVRNNFDSIGKPEKLTGDLKGYYSIRIDQKNRIVYKIFNDSLIIVQCASHYRDK